MKPNPLTIAIFEPEADGHHMTLYVHSILRETAKRGWKVHLVTTKRATQHPAYAEIETVHGGQYELHFMEDQQTPDTAGDIQRLKDQFKRLQNYRRAFRKLNSAHKIDAVFMVNLDQADLPMAFRGSPFRRSPFSGILIGRQFHCEKVGIKTGGLKRRDQVFEPIFRQILKIKSLKFVLAVDESLPMWAEQEKPNFYEKVRHLPDVSSISAPLDRAHSRAELGLPPEPFIILNYGALSERKGVSELLHALSDESCPKTVCGFFAGRQDTFTIAELKQPHAQKLFDEGRLFIRNSFLSAREELLAFSAADVVWLGYKQWYGSSGVLIQSAASEKPVLACNVGLIEYNTAKHKLGMTVNIEDRAQIVSALAMLAHSPDVCAEIGANGATFAASHSIEAFGKNVCDAILESTQG